MSDERRRQVLKVKIDPRLDPPVLLVDDEGVTHAVGHLAASDGAEFLINATAQGGDVRVGVQFVGKAVNT